MSDPLLEMLRSDPDDRDARALWADRLLSRGDPWGQLLALELAGETAAARRYRFDHRSALLGGLSEVEDPWRIEGTPPRTLELVVRMYGAPQDALLADLIERGVLVMLERLVFMGTANFDRLLQRVLANPWPCLRTLRLGPLHLGAGRSDVPLDGLATSAPRLEQLRLAFPHSLAFGHPTVQHLLVATTADVWSQLDPAAFPRLQRVDVHLRDGTPDVTKLQHVQVACNRKLDHPQQIAEERLSADRSPLLTPRSQTRVRRFQRDERFWQIRRDGPMLHLRYGKVGHQGRKQQVTRRSPYEAARDYRDRVIAKRAQGYREVWLEP